MDHGYMLAILDFPPEAACRAFSFVLNEFVYAQSIIVCFTALNAFIMVVMGKKVGLGTCDWKLVLVAFGVPLVFSIFFESFDLLGPSGTW